MTTAPRRPVPVLLGLAGLLAVPACGPAPMELPPERILLVVVDTLRRDHVAPYERGAPTPTLDALAEEGRVFFRARASFHQTTMSMASLFTGRTPSLEREGERSRLEWTGQTWCGMLRFAEEATSDECIPAGLTTLAEGLRGAGYWTAGVVTNKLLYRPGGYEQGFERWEELPGFAPTALEANRVVRDVLDARPHDRFFLYVHYMEVHDYTYWGDRYADAVAKADWAVGDLLNVLGAEGLREGTLVVVTSDHGERLGEEHFTAGLRGHNGNPSFDTLLEIPLIVAPPALGDPHAPVRSEDLYRRLLRAAGAEPTVAAELDPEELFLTEFGYQTLRAGRWKLFRERESGRVHLVDLLADPGETRDVAGDRPEVVAELEARMDALADRLAVRDVPTLELSEADRERLRALGYAAPRSATPARR